MKGIIRKIVAVISVFAIVFGVMAVAPLAASADIAVRLSDTTRVQGDQLTVEIYFPKNYNKISSLDMSLIYDADKLEFVSMKQSKDLRKARDKQTNGEVYSEYAGNPGKVNWCLAGGNNYEFTGIFSTVVFNVKSFADHGKCSVELKINHAANSGLVNLTDSVKASGASFEIFRNSMNDMELRLNDAQTGYIITAYNCAVYENVVISDTYKGLPVVGIDYEAFMNHAEIKSITFPSTLKYIGKESFFGCSGLTSLVISDNVTSIGEGAFRQCDDLESVSLPLGLEKIGTDAFAECPFLTSVELPFTLLTLGATAFRSCTLLETVKISKNTAIGTNAFKDCSDSLKFITVSDNQKLTQYISSSGIQAKTEIVKDISLGIVKPILPQQYEGEPIVPDAEVVLLSGEKVENGKDYKVVCRDNNAIGTATAYIVGIDGYGEGYVKQFKIACTHRNVTKTVVEPATCTKAGKMQIKCDACGETSEEEIPALGHAESGTWIYPKRPTITSTGSRYMLCKNCREKLKNETLGKVYPDLNGDNSVNSADALIVLRYSVDLETEITTEDQFIKADTNGDGKVNSVDALTILRITVGIVKI